MVILLDGTSALGRSAIAESVTELLPAWKHLALEVIEESVPEGMEDMRDRHIEIVRLCALELEKDDMHLIVSMPHAHEHMQTLRNEREPKCIAIHLGEGDEEGYDYAFDASVSSVKEIVGFLQKLILELPSKA